MFRPRLRAVRKLIANSFLSAVGRADRLRWYMTMALRTQKAHHFEMWVAPRGGGADRHASSCAQLTTTTGRSSP